MHVNCLEYHDVFLDDDSSASGFNLPGSELYKLDDAAFSEHINAFVEACITFHSGRDAVVEGGGHILTFDDGGVSAATSIAPRLEANGIRGCFLVTSGKIGTKGFVTAAQIRAMDSAGHCIGSHTHTHPLAMASLTAHQLDEEWRVSTDIIAQLIGRPVKTASVSGGYYSSKVAKSAAQNGIELLFTSEPTSRVNTVDGCKVLGRYTIKHGDGAEYAAALLKGRRAPRYRQFLLWNLKKAAKSALGPAYLRVRDLLLRTP